MKKFIKWNGYAIGEAFLGTALATYMFGNSAVSKALLVSGLGVFGMQALFGCASLTNKTNRRIYCKFEDSDELIECLSGETVYNIDGFKSDGKVYKVSDGVHVTANADGTVSYNSLSAYITNGLLKPTLLERLPGWGTLFDAKD